MKNYELTIPFRAPAAGTGKITFKALVKFGPANEGEFFWPNLAGDFSLNEASAPATSATSWRQSRVGQSCVDACAEAKLVCDDTKMSAVKLFAIRKIRVSRFEHFSLLLFN